MFFRGLINPPETLLALFLLWELYYGCVKTQQSLDREQIFFLSYLINAAYKFYNLALTLDTDEEVTDYFKKNPKRSRILLSKLRNLKNTSYDNVNNLLSSPQGHYIIDYFRNYYNQVKKAAENFRVTEVLPDRSSIKITSPEFELLPPPPFDYSQVQ